jgi:hypothetical protein
MITITLTDQDALDYLTLKTTAQVKAAVEQIDDLPAETPKPKRLSRAKAKPDLKAVEPAAEPAAEEAPAELDVDALRKQFEALVIKNYDAAVDVIDGLGVENFAEAIEKGLAEEVATALAEAV